VGATQRGSPAGCPSFIYEEIDSSVSIASLYGGLRFANTLDGFVRGSKEEALDLTTEEKKALKAAAESELAARAVR
jgi:hypothetical protein